jgi:hypothetical protein
MTNRGSLPCLLSFPVCFYSIWRVTRSLAHDSLLIIRRLNESALALAQLESNSCRLVLRRARQVAGSRGEAARNKKAIKRGPTAAPKDTHLDAADTCGAHAHTRNRRIPHSNKGVDSLPRSIKFAPLVTLWEVLDPSFRNTCQTVVFYAAQIKVKYHIVVQCTAYPEYYVES